MTNTKLHNHRMKIWSPKTSQQPNKDKVWHTCLSNKWTICRGRCKEEDKDRTACKSRIWRQLLQCRHRNRVCLEWPCSKRSNGSSSNKPIGSERVIQLQQDKLRKGSLGPSQLLRVNWKRKSAGVFFNRVVLPTSLHQSRIYLRSQCCKLNNCHLKSLQSSLSGQHNIPINPCVKFFHRLSLNISINPKHHQPIPLRHQRRTQTLETKSETLNCWTKSNGERKRSMLDQLSSSQRIEQTTQKKGRLLQMLPQERLQASCQIAPSTCWVSMILLRSRARRWRKPELLRWKLLKLKRAGGRRNTMLPEQRLIPHSLSRMMLSCVQEVILRTRVPQRAPRYKESPLQPSTRVTPAKLRLPKVQRQSKTKWKWNKRFSGTYWVNTLLFRCWLTCFWSQFLSASATSNAQ